MNFGGPVGTALQKSIANTVGYTWHIWAYMRSPSVNTQSMGQNYLWQSVTGACMGTWHFCWVDYMEQITLFSFCVFSLNTLASELLYCDSLVAYINTLSPGQNSRYFAGGIIMCILLKGILFAFWLDFHWNIYSKDNMLGVIQLILIPAWKGNCIYHKECDEITYPFHSAKKFSFKRQYELRFNTPILLEDNKSV